MTKANPGLYNPRQRERQLTLYVPGRRSLDEDWSVVKIDTVDKEEVRITRRDAEADEIPADRKPLIVMAREEAHVADILQKHVASAFERTGKRLNEMSSQERTQLLNEAWHDHVGQKLALFKGTSTIGRSLHLRQSFHRKSNW
jgi:hypothetical protein